MCSTIQISDIAIGSVVSFECVGIEAEGICVERDTGSRTIRYPDGSEGRITEGFIRECDSFSIRYAPVCACGAGCVDGFCTLQEVCAI
jgi:hypothetical protein